jgi:hypothetical protein
LVAVSIYILALVMDIRVIKKLHELIKTERTGPPKELCIKLGISERTVYNYISFMKSELNAPIKFSGQKASYFYAGNCELRFDGSTEEII